MATTGKLVKVCHSGLVVCLDSSYLGTSPDNKVIDGGCSDPFGLVEIKYSQTKYYVTPLDACSHENFCLEDIDAKPKLKTWSPLLLMHKFKDKWVSQEQVGVTF